MTGPEAIDNRKLARWRATRDDVIAAAIGAGSLLVDTGTGRVMATRGPRGRPLPAPRITGTLLASGYLACAVTALGQRRQARLNRVVWVAAHGIPPKGTVVGHKNNVKTDNRLANLYLTTPAGNAADAARDGLYVAPWKVTPEAHDTIRREYAAGATTRELADRHGLGKSQIHNIVSGRTR